MADLLQRIGQNSPFSSWKYAPVTEAGGASANNSRTQYIKECLRSKALWRAVLAITVIALLADIFHPTRKVLEHHGWVNDDAVANAKHAPSSSGVVDSPVTAPETVPIPGNDTVDWSQFAYCQYVTNLEYLCNSVMIFESLTRIGAKADKLMMYPQDWLYHTSEGDEYQSLLKKAKDEYGVKLVPVQVQHFGSDETWADSYTKLLAFNQTQYKRVLSLDSDSTVLQPMDELFLLPTAPVAMPRAYWLPEKNDLSSQLVLVEPSEFEFTRIRHRLEHHDHGDFDMEIVNKLYGKDSIIIPHRRYDLLTGEFRSDHHRNYLGSEEEEWDPDAAIKEAKFLHFSDWPLPKPWVWHEPEEFQAALPKCHSGDCRNREVWKWIYSDFLERREKICGSAFLPTFVETK